MEKKLTLVIRDREAGNIIEYANTIRDAQNLIWQYERQDTKDGTYTPDFYEVACLDCAIRTKVINAILNLDSRELRNIHVYSHTLHDHAYVGVYPDGDVINCIDGEDVECLYEITTGGYCNCDICSLYSNYDSMDKDEFIESYGEEEYQYCSDVAYEDALMEYNNENGIYDVTIIDEMLEALDSIPYGYFEDEEEDEEEL